MKTITILFIVTSHALMPNTGEPTGLWFEELSTPYYAFKDAGYDVTIASVDGGEIPIDPRSTSDNPQDLPESVQRFMKDEQAMAAITDAPAVNMVDTAQYEAIFFPGGHGTMWDYPNNDELAGIITDALDDNRVVAAVCHGPAVLVGVTDDNGEPLVKGRKITGFTNEEEEAVGLTDAVPFLLETRLRELGAEFEKTGDFEPFVVSDGNLMTGQNPASSGKLAQMVIERLESSRNAPEKKAAGQ